jgi:hypothetical protein
MQDTRLIKITVKEVLNELCHVSYVKFNDKYVSKVEIYDPYNYFYITDNLIIYNGTHIEFNNENFKTKLVFVLETISVR